MTTEITKNLMCILMRSGIEVWVDEAKVDEVIAKMEGKSIFRIGNQVINPADISGIFDPKVMKDNWYRKNGYWKCEKADYWHRRNEECGHK